MAGTARGNRLEACSPCRGDRAAQSRNGSVDTALAREAIGPRQPFDQAPATYRSGTARLPAGPPQTGTHKISTDPAIQLQSRAEIEALTKRFGRIPWLTARCSLVVIISGCTAASSMARVPPPELPIKTPCLISSDCQNHDET